MAKRSLGLKRADSYEPMLRGPIAVLRGRLGGAVADGPGDDGAKSGSDATRAITTTPATATRASPRRGTGRRACAVLPGGRTENTSTGSARPLSRFLPPDLKTTGTLPWVRPRTVAVTRTSPGLATAQTREATLTAVPTNVSAVSTTSPAWMPTPTCIGPSACASFWRAAPSTMANPHMTALDADLNTT